MFTLFKNNLFRRSIGVNHFSFSNEKDNKLNLHATLWPSFNHFDRFATDYRLSGLRLNSAMSHLYNLDDEFEIIKNIKEPIPLWFDIKGRQLRVTEIIPDKSNLVIELNHEISVETPTVVLFKAGADVAFLDKIEKGKRLIFKGGPKYLVKAGESLHIRHPSLKVHGNLFTIAEIERIQKVKKFGFNKFYLSYVESQNDIDEFREFIGTSEVIAKIENKAGLDFVAKQFKKSDNLSLMAARGDLYVEIDKPHDILSALKLIVKKDPEAFVGSRFLLSIVKSPVPELSDLSDLAWCETIGYKNFLLCDELCLKEDMLGAAINTFEAFKSLKI